MGAKYTKLAMFSLAALSAGALYATDYYWVGAEGGDLKTASNWSETQGGNPCESVTINSSANLVFPSNASVTMSASCDAGTVTFNGDVTFTSSSAVYLNLTQSTSGSGRIILDGSVYIRAASREITIANPVSINGTTGQNGFRPNYDKGITHTGALFGDGVFLCKQGNYPSSYSSSAFTKVALCGDISAFTGTGKVYIDNDKCNAKMYFDGATDMSRSKWEIHVASNAQIPKVNEGQFPFQNANTTYKFGSLRANLPGGLVTSGNLNNITLELGELVAADSYLTGTWGGVSGAAVVWKAAVNVLTNDCANTASITVSNGGGVAFPSEAGIPTTLTFSNGGSLWVADATTLEKVREVMTVTVGSVTATVGAYFTVTLTGDKTADWKGSIVPSSSAYVWCGGESGNFNEAANWSLNGNVLATYKSPQPALFTNEVNVTLNADVNMNGACMLYDVTFSGTKYLNQYGTITGPGKITYSDGVVLRNASGTCTVANDVEIPSGATVQFATHKERTTTWNGVFTGSGTINLKEYGTSDQKKGITIFAGEMGNFEGKIQTNYAISDSYVQFSGVATNMANATVTLGSTGNATALCAAAGTYTFGSLSGKVTGGSTDVTIVTGSLDSEEKSIAYTAGSGSWTLTKKGSQKLTVTSADFASYILDGGKIVTVGEQTIGTTITTTVAGKCVNSLGNNTYKLSTRGLLVIIQ